MKFKLTGHKTTPKEKKSTFDIGATECLDLFIDYTLISPSLSCSIEDYSLFFLFPRIKFSGPGTNIKVYAEAKSASN